MAQLKGIIALDIDGTITIDKHHLDEKVHLFLNQLIASGWELIFITGRTYSFARPVLSEIRGTYHFAVQNGAAVYEMPSEKQLYRNYVPVEVLREYSGVLYESGKENGDICYYFPADFTQEQLKYLDYRNEITPEPWVALESFDDLPVKECAVGKVFGTSWPKADHLNVIGIHDPFNPGDHVALLNAKHASKGEVLATFREKLGTDLPAIAAGNDLNDVCMLEKSTFKIVMEDAPKQMHPLADIIAKPAEEHGIINALKEALKRYGWSD